MLVRNNKQHIMVEEESGGSSGSSASAMITNILLRLLSRCTTILTGLTGLALGVLYVKQESLLYHPTIAGQVPRHLADNPRRFRSPSEHNVPFETIMITCADGLAIHSWLLYHPPSSSSSSSLRPTIIWFHGNAGNIGLRLPQAIQMYNALHVNVWMIEYRGFGDSQDPSSSSSTAGGKINEAGIKLDAEAVWDYANNKYHHHHPRTSTTTTSSSSSSRVTNNDDDRIISANVVLDPKKMFVFGQSLGGAVAFHLAQYAQQKQLLASTSTTATTKVVASSSIDCYAPLAGIIVENTFLSISDMVDHLLPYVRPIKYLILRMHWDSGTIVRHLHHTPALFIAGAQDTLVPHVHMLHLYGRMKSSVQSASSSSSSSSSSIATKVNTDLVRLHIVKDGTHNDTWMKGGREYWTTISRFMNDALFVLDNSNSGSSSSSGSGSDGNSASGSAGSSHGASTNIAATARGAPPLFQRKSSINGGVSSSTNRGECLGSSSIEVDSGGGGEDSVELISGVANFLGMASNVLKKGSTNSGEARAYKKKE